MLPRYKTDMAHEESVTSPFFSARLKEVKPITQSECNYAIQRGDLDQVCRIAEADSLSLHAVTMTGRTGLVLMSPDTIRVIQRIRKLRNEEHIPVWYSLDTGPSVYINTHPEHLDYSLRRHPTKYQTQRTKEQCRRPSTRESRSPLLTRANTMSSDITEKIRKAAVLNAIKHDGKAELQAVLGNLLGDNA